MFQYRYEPLLSVQFKHPYYFSGVSEDFDCLPTAATTDLLQQYNLKLAQTKGGLKILCKKEYTAPSTTAPITPVDQPLDLYFIVRVNSNILNLCDLVGLPKCYWLSNLNPDGTFKNNLAHGPTLSVADELAFTVTPLSLQLAFPSGLYHQIQINSPSRSIDLSPNQEALFLTLPRSGQYRVSKIKTDGTKDETDYLCDDTLYRSSSHWAVLHLRMDESLDYDPANAKQYILSLPQRQSTWRYFVALSKARRTVFSIGADLRPTFSLAYEVASPYPSTTIALKPNASWTTDEKTLASAIQNDKIAAIYLFETAAAVPLFEASPPKIKLTNGTRTTFLPTPKRDQYTTNPHYWTFLIQSSLRGFNKAMTWVKNRVKEKQMAVKFANPSLKIEISKVFEPSL